MDNQFDRMFSFFICWRRVGVAAVFATSPGLQKNTQREKIIKKSPPPPKKKEKKIKLKFLYLFWDVWNCFLIVPVSHFRCVSLKIAYSSSYTVFRFSVCSYIILFSILSCRIYQTTRVTSSCSRYIIENVVNTRVCQRDWMQPWIDN